MMRSPLARSFVLSPNIEPRRGGLPIDMIVLHYTGMASAAAATAWLCNPLSGVSCHYLVLSDGGTVQMVGEEMRAWHAGVSGWEGETDTNSRSIGIEVHNPGHTLGYAEFPVRQMEGVAALCHDILSRHAIAPARILAHSDVAPARKIDPGEKFDWGFLFRQGLGHWVEAAPDAEGPVLQPGDSGTAVEELQSILHGYGYGLAVTGKYDAATKTVVSAFQRHFRRSRVDGLGDPGTIATLRRLIASLSS